MFLCSSLFCNRHLEWSKPGGVKLGLKNSSCRLQLSLCFHTALLTNPQRGWMRPVNYLMWSLVFCFCGPCGMHVVVLRLTGLEQTNLHLLSGCCLQGCSQIFKWLMFSLRWSTLPLLVTETTRFVTVRVKKCHRWTDMNCLTLTQYDTSLHASLKHLVASETPGKAHLKRNSERRSGVLGCICFIWNLINGKSSWCLALKS